MTLHHGGMLDRSVMEEGTVFQPAADPISRLAR